MTIDAYKKTIDFLCQTLHVDIHAGLSSVEATNRLQTYGPNSLPEKRGVSAIIVLLRQFTSPLMFVLLIASIASIIIGEKKDALVILIAVIINVIVGFIQELKAERASQALKSYEVDYCSVLREGRHVSIESKKIVPGDIVFLSAGSRVPADIRLAHTVDLTVEEALLTGESKPIKKNTEKLEETLPIGDRINMAYAGTYVLSGKATGIVTHTGMNTELGKIAGLILQTHEEATPLQVQIKRFSWLLGSFLLAITLLVALIAYLKNMPLHELVTISIALAVAAIPEGLLVAVTAILAIGMHRMLKRKALVRHLIAAETLGSVSVICTDKTGTLTQGRMQVVRLATQERDIHVHDDMSRDVFKEPDLQEFIQACILNNDADVLSVTDRIIGNPTEIALLEFARFTHVYDIEEIVKKFSREQEIPFSSDIKYMATLHTLNGQKRLIVKGAPEKIFAMCKQDDLGLKRFVDLSQSMVADGLRILALAIKDITLNSGQEAQEKQGSQDAKKIFGDLSAQLSDLTCIGLIGIQDPLRSHAAQTIEDLKKAGIHVVIVTGDHKDTARNIAQSVGLDVAHDGIMTGQDFDTLSQEELKKRITEISVFARVEPKHKIHIVKAWQERGHAVAMTGDGVNDAPALKAADIGVALGSGSDVSHEVSDMVLLDNNLSVISQAVRQGRIIFDNIRKVIVYLMADSFSEIILIGGALVAGFPLPLLASQIFWINLVTDGFPNIALTLEPGEPEIMLERPRKKTEPVVNTPMKILIFVIGIVTDIGLFALYILLLRYSIFDLPHIRTIMFTSLAIDSLLYVFSVRSLRTSLFRMNPFSNRWLLLAVGAGFLVQLFAVYAPFMQPLFSTVSLGLFEWTIILSLALVKLIAIEITKDIFIARKK